MVVPGSHDPEKRKSAQPFSRARLPSRGFNSSLIDNDEFRAEIKRATKELPRTVQYKLVPALASEGLCEQAIGQISSWGKDVPVRSRVRILHSDREQWSSGTESASGESRPYGYRRRIGEVYPQLVLAVVTAGKKLTVLPSSATEYCNFSLTMSNAGLYDPTPDITVSVSAPTKNRLLNKAACSFSFKVESLEEGLAVLEGGCRGCYFVAVGQRLHS